MKKLKKVFLVHGEPEAQENLKNEFEKAGVRDIGIVKYGEEYDIT